MKKKILLSLVVISCLVGVMLVATGASVYLDKYGPIGAKMFGQLTMKNTHQDAYFIKATNRDAAARFYVDSAGSVTGTSVLARIDSFATTSKSKLVAWKGATLGDVFAVSQYIPAYSAVADTGMAYAWYYYNTDTISVTRTGSANAPKSGALFSLIGINR